eukprot:TRINITY_DN11949_c0_g1_i1.p1 TRINITY_DN11949_c0_g1~~TRINITY_DN11949_c0_g1_i1.p1  ORF type:complete len:613 (+),score=86.53 TRINITY_DN11949_c0_g1_i1:564-2402(+)
MADAWNSSAKGACLVAGLAGGFAVGYLLGRRRSQDDFFDEAIRRFPSRLHSPRRSPHLSPLHRPTEDERIATMELEKRLADDAKERRLSAEADMWGHGLTRQKSPLTPKPPRALSWFARQVTGGTPPISPGGHNAPFDYEEDLGRVYGLGGYSQSSRVLLCMVGLPARGKSYITKMLIRYLTWSGFPVKAFNAGNVRRQEGMASASASFFNDQDAQATQRREAIAEQCMLEAIEWLRMHKSVCVAIFDATNTTKKRRKKIIDQCTQSKGITPVFVESICDNAEILEKNYALKLGNDDYQAMDPAVARADFLERVKAYEKRYETITDDECDGGICYVKLFNVGQKVEMHRCSGYLMSNIGFFMSNIHISPRCIWLTRHAESEDQLAGVLGSHRKELTHLGRQYSRNLASFLKKCKREMEESGSTESSSEMLVLMGTVPVHYSTLQAMISSAPNLGDYDDEACSPGGAVHCKEFQAMSSSLLNELDGGVCNGLSYDDIRRDYPDLWEARERDKLRFRYPNGESYQDVIGRLRPIIIELERQRRSILVISHLAVQRCLYAYFTGCPMEELPYLEMDMHTVVELRPGAFDCGVRHVQLAETSDANLLQRKASGRMP